MNHLSLTFISCFFSTFILRRFSILCAFWFDYFLAWFVHLVYSFICAVSCNSMQLHTTPCNSMQLHATPCNSIQLHALRFHILWVLLWHLSLFRSIYCCFCSCCYIWCLKQFDMQIELHLPFADPMLGQFMKTNYCDMQLLHVILCCNALCNVLNECMTELHIKLHVFFIT